MKSAYRVFAYLIALEVLVQAAAIAYALTGLGKWIQDGNTLDKAAMDDESTTFDGVVGFMIHGINGQMVIPLLAIIFLIVSFFAKVPGGVLVAFVIVLLVAAQVLMGIYGHTYPKLGILHGINALILFALAGMAGRRAVTSSSPMDMTEAGRA